MKWVATSTGRVIERVARVVMLVAATLLFFDLYVMVTGNDAPAEQPLEGPAVEPQEPKAPVGSSIDEPRVGVEGMG